MGGCACCCGSHAQQVAYTAQFPNTTPSHSEPVFNHASHLHRGEWVGDNYLHLRTCFNGHPAATNELLQVNISKCISTPVKPKKNDSNSHQGLLWLEIPGPERLAEGQKARGRL